MKFKEILRTNLKNIPGKRFTNLFCVIECDDWGGIRMPSGEVLDELKKAGLRINSGRFNNDTLETSDDLEQLFNVLDSVRDSKGRPAVFTPVTIVANPDYEKIRETGFNEYHYEQFTDTLQRYGRGREVFDLWKQGIDYGIFIPELHGRDHLAVQFWLNELKKGNRDLLFAFDKGFTALNIPGLAPELASFRSEFYYDSDTQLPFLKKSIHEAVSIFTGLFGRHPNAFVPANGVFHPVFEKDVVETGIKYLYMNRTMSYRKPDDGIERRNYISGQRSPEGLMYYTRNCVFEPSAEDYRGIEYTLMQVAAAFRWHKPAIISTHRVNFCGGINPSMRQHGLSELKRLLSEIVKKWPDIEFVSSAAILDNYYPAN